jgi:hypothetical protein
MTKVRFSRILACAAMLVGMVFSPAAVFAQYVEPPPPAAYALQDVSVVFVDGEVAEGMTILIRNGLIEDMGTDIDVPTDAKILEGDSLFVYPGFVDAQGKADYEFPEASGDVQITSWAPPRSAQNFLPHRRVVDYLTATGEDLAASRKQGVVAAAVHPDGRMVPGRGAVLLFRKDAETPAELVLTTELGPTMSFRGAQGVYPSTPFAVIAFYRQSFEDALRDGIIETEYARDPRGMQTPSWDPDYAVLRNVAAGGDPVFFTANRSEEIRNVLELSQEYGFRPVIVGGGEAWRVTDELLERNVPVLVSLDFPTPNRWKPEVEAEEADSAGADSTAAEAGEAGEEQAEPEEPGPAALREKARLENLYSNPGRLAAAGVTFALTSGGGEADIREGVLKAMEYGLSEADALRAVTTTPAELLGIPNVLRIEKDMAATFVVATGPIFDEGTKIAYTFVEGALEEGSTGGGGAGSGDAPAVNMSGTWEMTMMGEMAATLTLNQEPDGSLSGSFSFDMGSGEVSGSVSGDKIAMTIHISAGGQSIEAEVTGTVEGDTASGDATSPMGDFPWTARRTGGPGEEVRR